MLLTKIVGEMLLTNFIDIWCWLLVGCWRAEQLKNFFIFNAKTIDRILFRVPSFAQSSFYLLIPGSFGSHIYHTSLESVQFLSRLEYKPSLLLRMQHRQLILFHHFLWKNNAA